LITGFSGNPTGGTAPNPPQSSLLLKICFLISRVFQQFYSLFPLHLVTSASNRSRRRRFRKSSDKVVERERIIGRM